MNTKKSPFIKIDEFIFQKIDYLKTEGFFLKFNDVLANLNEEQQKLTAQLTTFISLLVPFLFAAFLWYGNFQTKKNIAIKKQIIDQIALLEGHKNTLNNISANYLSPSSIISQDDLDNRIKNLLSNNSIDSTKVNISSFSQSSSSSSVSRVEAEVLFKDFGTLDFSNFLRGLIENEKFKITKVDLTKNNESKLLQGRISVIHLGQNFSQSE
jgi:hypothetical protein